MSTDLEKNLKTYRLSEAEYQKMKSVLQREPSQEPSVIEWCLFSALWSEHCSYKSSKNQLKKFSFRNSSTPLMDGENAGVVDLGFGEKIAFKMESHNHPSFIEPVQGAATGVGGILRDIFTMGARPIMTANYLCFGDVHAEKMTALQQGVVKGISTYGNCVGVPTVTGQTNYHKKYNKNILVNALNVGYFAPGQKMALSNAAPRSWQGLRESGDGEARSLPARELGRLPRQGLGGPLAAPPGEEAVRSFLPDLPRVTAGGGGWRRGR